MTILEALIKQFSAYARLMRLDRPIGNYLLLWPTLWALWVAAEGFPQGRVLVIFVLGVFVMRAAGCIINDFADRNIDDKVKRTAQRPLATGEVTTTEAWILFGLLLLVALYLVMLTNTLTLSLALIAVVLVVCYPFMKRYTYLPQVILGAAFSMAIPMGFAAETGDVPAIAWLLYTANLVWTVAYDTLYAMCDRDDDVKIGVRSTAILFGNGDKLAVFGLQIIFLVMMVLVGQQIEALDWYYAGLIAALLLFLYQQFLVRDRDKDACFQAFLNNHWVGMLIFIGLLCSFAYSA